MSEEPSDLDLISFLDRAEVAVTATGHDDVTALKRRFAGATRGPLGDARLL